jgi:hypothetical protein
LGTQEKIRIIEEKILSYTPTVKGKIAFANGLRFQAQIENLQIDGTISIPALLRFGIGPL